MILLCEGAKQYVLGDLLGFYMIVPKERMDLFSVETMYEKRTTESKDAISYWRGSWRYKTRPWRLWKTRRGQARATRYRFLWQWMRSQKESEPVNEEKYFRFYTYAGT